MSEYIIPVLVIQLLTSGIVVWFVWRYRRERDINRPADVRPHVADQEKARRLHSLLGKATRVLAEHATELGQFEQSLESDRSRQRVEKGGELGDQIQDVRQANKRVEATLDQVSACFATLESDLSSVDRPDVATYQEKTKDLEHVLEATEADDLLASVASKLLDMVRDLQRDNVGLRTEIVAAKDQVIEQMSRAHAAEQLARVDALTQLPNRRSFEEAHIQCQSALERHGQPYSLVLLDLDHFKAVNDQHGHAAGDAVLGMVGRLIAETRRTSDHACRLGGEEFALLLPKCGQESAESVAERYRQKIESATLRFRNQTLSITASAGVAEAAAGEPVGHLLERADAALYAAKSQGRNRVCGQDALAVAQAT